MSVQSPGLLINIGCGKRACAGWLNIDKSPNAWLARHAVLAKTLRLLRMPGVAPEGYRDDIVVRWASSGIPAPDESASWVYSSHVIGSMSPESLNGMLREVRRVLRPDGRLRLVTLDLELVAARWREAVEAYQKAGTQAMSAPPGFDLLRRLDLALFSRVHLSRFQRAFDAPVQMLYDFDMLRHVLLEAGFSSVVRRDVGESEMPDVAYLDHIPGSLAVEATR
jgi:predicted SAM-dependent methyltransferase